MLHLGLSENDLQLLIRDLESHQLRSFAYLCIKHLCVYGFVEIKIGFTCPQGSAITKLPTRYRYEIFSKYRYVIYNLCKT